MAERQLNLYTAYAYSDAYFDISEDERRGVRQMIAEQAVANDATLVNWYQASIGHDSCKSLSNRWVEPLIPSELAFPIHPNKAGMAGGAATLEAAINK